MLGWDGGIDWMGQRFQFRPTDVVLSDSKTGHEAVSLASVFPTSSRTLSVDQATLIQLTAYVGSISTVVRSSLESTEKSKGRSEFDSKFARLSYYDGQNLPVKPYWDRTPSDFESLICVGTREVDSLLILAAANDRYHWVAMCSLLYWYDLVGVQDRKTGKIQDIFDLTDVKSYQRRLQKWWKSFSSLQTIVIG